MKQRKTKCTGPLCAGYLALALMASAAEQQLVNHFRDQLRALHERWLGLGPLGRVVSILAVTLAVLYGGTKSPTNEVTGTGVTGVSPVAGCAVARNTGATAVSPVAGWGPNGQDARWPSASADGQDARWPSVSNGQDATTVATSLREATFGRWISWPSATNTRKKWRGVDEG